MPSFNQSSVHTVTFIYLLADRQAENRSVAASHSLSRSLPLPYSRVSLIPALLILIYLPFLR